MGKFKFQSTSKCSQNKISQFSKGKSCSLGFEISQLPDDILGHILSHLSLKEAVATSILSSRWRYLWRRRTTCLDFDCLTSFQIIWHRDDLHKMAMLNFVKSVNLLLKSLECVAIEELKVCYVLDYRRFKNDIDEWIKFALSKNVQRLELNLSPIRREMERAYAFSQDLFFNSISHKDNNSTDHECPLRFGITMATLGFKSLKQLCLSHLNVSDGVVEFLLSNCPELERLSIKGCWTSVNFKVISPLSCQLKYLEIARCLNMKSIEISNASLISLVIESVFMIQFIKISNVTNLVSFKYIGCDTNLLLQNAPNTLVDVCIGHNIVRAYYRSLLNPFFVQLSCCLKTLKLRYFGLVGNPSLLLSKLIALNELVLEFNLRSDDINPLVHAGLIRMCPNLEKFVIWRVWNWSVRIDRQRKIRRTVGLYTHKCIKEVKLGGYYGSRSDLEFALFFIDNAVALEKIIIDPRDQSHIIFDRPLSKYIGDQPRTKLQRIARSRAKQQLEGKVADGVELVIL